MKKRFTFLIAALMLLVFMTPSMVGWGQSTVTFDATTDITANAQSYQTNVLTINAADGSTWKATGYGATANTNIVIGKGGANYLETPSVNGTISEVAVTWSGNTSYYLALKTTDGTELSNYQNPSTSTTKIFTVSGSYSQLRLVGRRSSGASNAAATITKVVVTYTTSGGGGGSQATATTTTIDATGITNTDLNTSAAAGSLSATVSANNTPIEGATVTWSGNNNAVATIDSDGVVTLIGAGTVTFTAAYAGVSGTYQPSSATHQMTVTYQPTTIEITPNYTFWGKTSSFSGNDYSHLEGAKDNVSLEWNKGNGSTYASTTAMRFYKDNTLTFTAPTGYEIKSIVITFSSTQSDLSFSPAGYTLSGSTGTWTGASNTVTMSRPSNASSYAQITKFTITIGLPSSVETPTFSPAAGNYIGAQNITIACETTGAAIYYTLDGTTPTESSTLYSGAINITSNTTIKAIAIKEDESSSVATAEYTITTPLTTMQEIYDKAVEVGSTTTNVYITFNNWVVSGVASYYAFVTDGTKGFYINNYSGHGFHQGDVLSGTANCPLYLYNGSARLNITSSTSGLQINTGGSVAVADIPMADLSGVNTGAVVSYHDLTYNNSLLSDGTTSIKPYTTLYNYSSLTTGKKYNVTGVYWQYNTSTTSTKEVLPRSSSEICLAAQMTAPSFEPFSYLYSDGGPATQNLAISGTDFTEALTVTAPENYQVSNDNSTWGTTTTFAQSSGNVSGTLYVRLVGGLEVGTYNGDLTFTSGNYLTTKTSALAGTVSANATYAITLNQSSEATIAADYAVAEEGQKITLSYSNLDDCYTLTGWTVLDGNADEVTVTNNQFTMPASAVEVEGIFTKKTFKVQYSVNGEIKTALDQTGIDCGDAVTLKTASDISAASIVLPTGYTFAGWSTEAGNTNIISSLIVSANTTLYAVLLPSGAATSFVKVTSLSDITAGTYFIVSDLYVLPSATTSSAPVMSVDYIIGESLSDTYNTPINGTLWYFTGTYDAMTIKNGDNNYLYTINQNNGVRVGSTSGTWTFETNSTGFAMKSNNNRYCATTDNIDWRSYSTANSQYYHDGGKIYLYKEVIPTSYTLIEEITATDATLPSIEPTYLITVENGGVLTLEGPNNGTAENLIIEDGGQLIVHNSGVQATVKKALPEATGEAKTTGWTTIASPVRNISIGTPSQAGNVTHLKDVDYALYRLNEVSMEWENHKNTEDHADFTTLESGRGYLYSRTSLETLAYVGEVNGSAYEEYNLSITSANATRGFHLIGNPYSHDIYKGAAGSDYAIPNSAEAGYSNDYVLAKGFYRLKNSMTWIPELDGTKIEKGEGILVKATTEGTLRIYNSAAKPAVKANDDNIMFAVANSQYKDVTYALFDKGMGLNKIDHRDENAPMLYIPQNGENYAIAMMDDNTNAFNLNFEAKTTGSYTLSFKADGEFNYLHVIDRLTGEDIDMLVEGEYSFVGSPRDNANRFIVRLGYLPNYSDNGDDIFAYQNGNDIIVSGEGELQIFDVMGRMVSSQRINGVETMCTSSLQNGVYVFRLNEKTQKIVVR